MNETDKNILFHFQVQFCFVFASMVVHSVLPGCKVNSVLIVVSLGQAIFFFVLFFHFYMTSYKKGKSEKPDLSSETEAKFGRMHSYENGKSVPIKRTFL